MRVLKFGGSSVANATNISKVLDIVENEATKEPVILVCSAIKGCTDALIAGEASILEAFRSKHLDIINRLFTGSQKAEAADEINALFEEIASLCKSNPKETPLESYGEVLSTKIIARKLSCEGYDTLWLDSRDVIVKDDEMASYQNIAEAIKSKHQIFVAPGFIARDAQGNICTLGRGGSDYSAALYAAGCKASNLEIWTDVPGMMTTNPKVVPAAKTIANLSYEAALNLAENGAKVLYAPTVFPAMKAGISFSILNTFDPSNPGTLVSNLPEPKATVFRGVTSVPYGNRARLCLVSEGPVNQEHTLKRMTAALKEAGIRLIDSSIRDNGKMIFVEVLPAEEKAATAAIHAEFFEHKDVAVINLFLAGYGQVSKAVIALLQRGEERIARRTGKSIRIIGISNSSKYVIDLKGIALGEIENLLGGGEDAGNAAFFDAIRQCAPRGAVLADCTNSFDTYKQYESLFEKGIGVVSSNRRSLAVPYSQYVSMKNTAHDNGVIFKYGTTVGNALPILESLSSGVNSCDKVRSIEAVVSCTLNQLISNYDGDDSATIAGLLRTAQLSGLTEKDPRTDLEGQDALRKLLIMAREAGIPLEENDVTITPMVGPEFFEGSIEDFYAKMEASEPDFARLERELQDKDLRQRFVAEVVADKSSKISYTASIQMKTFGPESPFYWISGTENVMQITSENISHPLVLKGSGEGAELAASGVVNEILTK